MVIAAGGRAQLEFPDHSADTILSATIDGGLAVARNPRSFSVRAGYEPLEATLSIRCTDGSIGVPISVEPLRFEPVLQWSADDMTAPAGREYFAWWIDPVGTPALYLFGGFVYEPVQFTPSNEFWQLDLERLAWTRLPQEGTSPLSGGRVAPDGAGGVYYFGGASVAADRSLDTPPILTQVRVGTSAVWEDAPAAGALGSFTGSFVFDEARNRWLSVCGVETRRIGFHCQVHEYRRDTGFVELNVEGIPPAGRYGFHYAFDAETDRVVIFGGQTGTTLRDIAADTWILELAPDGDSSHPRWVQLFERADGLAPRRNGAYAFDPQGHRLFVWGGTDGRSSIAGLDVLQLDRGEERWVHVSLPHAAPPRTSGGGVYDPARERILWGLGNDGRAVYRDVWELHLGPTGGV